MKSLGILPTDPIIWAEVNQVLLIFFFFRFFFSSRSFPEFFFFRSGKTCLINWASTKKRARNAIYTQKRTQVYYKKSDEVIVKLGERFFYRSSPIIVREKAR